jgi:hypothetical protein
MKIHQWVVGKLVTPLGFGPSSASYYTFESYLPSQTNMGPRLTVPMIRAKVVNHCRPYN